LIVLPEVLLVLSPKTGRPEPIRNPMYEFRTAKPMGDYGKYSLTAITDSGVTYPYDKCEATSRCPPPPTPENLPQWVNGVEDNNQVVSALREHDWYESHMPDSHTFTDTLGEAVSRLFSVKYFSTYDSFASTRLYDPSPPPEYLSLEDIHNNIHNWTGGENAGHMGMIPVAAFDPIFWMHHANVDRQFAIWQTLNPTLWFDSPDQQLTDPDGNWSTKPNTIDTPKTPLAPFHTDKQGTYFTSVTCRDWTKYGYSYPELQPWLPKYIIDGKFSEQAYIDDINSQLNALYGTTRSLVLKNHHLFDKIGHDNSVEHDDYIVNVLYERFALGGAPFTIHILIGKDVKVGSTYNFSTPIHTTGGPDGCGNCRRQEAIAAKSTGQVPITTALLRNIQDGENPLKSLKLHHVEPYLKANLHWKVTRAGGIEVPLESIPSLKVSLAAGKGNHYKDKAKPSRYHDYTVIHSVTEGRPGGAGRE